MGTAAAGNPERVGKICVSELGKRLIPFISPCHSLQAAADSDSQPVFSRPY